MQHSLHHAAAQHQTSQRPSSKKVFVLVSCEMAEISKYLEWAAFIESFGRPIKVDDISTTLAHKIRREALWTTGQLSPNQFLVAFPDKSSIQSLMSQGHIRGDGFTLTVNHRNQYRGGARHNLKLKIFETLHNLPLSCWTTEAVATIIFGFGVLHRASCSSLLWEDLSGFDVVFYCKNFQDILKTIEVIVGP